MRVVFVVFDGETVKRYLAISAHEAALLFLRETGVAPAIGQEINLNVIEGDSDNVETISFIGRQVIIWEPKDTRT